MNFGTNYDSVRDQAMVGTGGEISEPCRPQQKTAFSIIQLDTQGSCNSDRPFATSLKVSRIWIDIGKSLCPGRRFGVYTDAHIELARSSTLFSMNMVKMLKVVQRQVKNDKLRVEDVGYTSTGDDEINSRSVTDVSTGPHDLNFFIDDIATIWRINSPLILVTDTDTMADQIFTWVTAPELQKQFHVHCVLNKPVNGSWTPSNFSYGESASGLQATGVSYGTQAGQVLGKAYLRGSFLFDMNEEY